MPTVFSPNKNLPLQATGENAGTWGIILDGALSQIDLAFGGRISLNVAGGADFTVNSTQAQNVFLTLTGLLTASINLLLPPAGSFFVVKNTTTGNFTVTVKTTAGGSTGVIVPQGSSWFIYSDSTNVSPMQVADGTMLYGVDSGTASAAVVTTRVPITALKTGYTVRWKTANNVAAAATVNIDTLGAKAQFIPSTSGPAAVTLNYYTANSTIMAVYDEALNSGAGAWLIIAGAAAQSSTPTFGDTVTLVSTDAGATASPTINLFRDSASPAANDIIGQSTDTGRNSSASIVTYGQRLVRIDDPTAGTEDSSYIFNLLTNGAATPILINAFGQSIGSITAARASEARVTLASGTPITTGNITAATTLFLTPYRGDQRAIFNGTRWEIRAPGEFSVAVPATTNTPFDVFEDYNGGSLQLVTTSWTNTTTRATALALQNGILVKSGTPTQRYWATLCTTGVSGQTEDSQANRLTWNYYNRLSRSLLVQEATSSWTYSSVAFRQANANAANKISIVCGVAEDTVNMTVLGALSSITTAGGASVGVGINSTTAATGSSPVIGVFSTSSGAGGAASNTFQSILGKNDYNWLESGLGSGTQTWRGGSVSGLYGSCMA